MEELREKTRLQAAEIAELKKAGEPPPASARRRKLKGAAGGEEGTRGRGRGRRLHVERKAQQTTATLGLTLGYSRLISADHG